MQMIEAIINPARFESVKEALARYGILGVTAIECHGIGRELPPPRPAYHRGNGPHVDLVRKILLKVCVKDYEISPAVEAIRAAGRTGAGAVGDGKVFVFPVAHAIRIRTGDEDDEAL